MKEALGLVEIMGLSNTIIVADTMLKTSNVKLIDIENTKGLGYMTIKVTGDVGAVNAAINSGKKVAVENNAFISGKVIPRPSDYIGKVFCQPKEEIESNVFKEEEIKEEINEQNDEQSIINYEKVENKVVEFEENNLLKKDDEKNNPKLIEDKAKKGGRKKKVVKKEDI